MRSANNDKELISEIDASIYMTYFCYITVSNKIEIFSRKQFLTGLDKPH